MKRRKRKKRIFVDTTKVHERPTAVKNQKQIKAVKRQIKKELQVGVQSELSGTFSTTPAISHIDPQSGSVKGITVVGVRAKLMSVRMKGFIKGADVNTQESRIDLVLDRDPVPGTIATFDEIYYPAISSPSINVMRLPTNRERFKILASIVGAPHSGAGGNRIVFFDRYVKMGLIIESKTAASFTQANQRQNAILVVRWCTNATTPPSYKLCTQCVIKDDN